MLALGHCAHASRTLPTNEDEHNEAEHYGDAQGEYGIADQEGKGVLAQVVDQPFDPDGHVRSGNLESQPRAQRVEDRRGERVHAHDGAGYRRGAIPTEATGQKKGQRSADHETRNDADECPKGEAKGGTAGGGVLAQRAQ